jgi:hypothetical protein
MNRLWAAVIAVLALAAAPQEKQTLRYKFTKGESFPYRFKYAMGIKLDKVPEIFQGVMGEDPIDLKMEALLDVRVKDVAADGSATLEGTWKTLTAKGHVMVNDVDFAYDADKKATEKPKKADEPQEPALEGVLNLEDQLRRTVAQTMQLTADPFGRLSVKADGGRAQELEGLFRSLNGLMGALPKDGIAKGDAWKDETKVSIPAAGSTVDVKIATDNLYEADEDVKGRSCARLLSKFKVGQVEKKDDPNNVFNLQIKTDGEGEGRTWFSAKDGRAVKTQSALKVRVNAVIPNPGGGDDIELKATVKMDQSGELGN